MSKIESESAELLRWKRVEYPPPHVKKVRNVTDGTIWEDRGAAPYFWVGPGWPEGVHWTTMLVWSDFEEVVDNDVKSEG